MKNISLITFAFLIFFACKTKEVEVTNHQSSVKSVILDENKNLSTIAFGSCSKPTIEQPLWSPIIANNPDLWIWLGDIVYGDTENMSKLKAKYDQQDQNSGYQKLKIKTPVIGVWDDHDYGVNDGGKEYPKRKESREVLFDFLNVSTTSKDRKHEGAYQSYTFGEVGKQVKIILLDARYFRDQVERQMNQNPQYIPNPTGTILGAEQWSWLEAELKNSTAQIHLIASGIQIIPIEHNYEKWNTFPSERNRLFGLLVKYQVPQVVFLSGDRHIGEVSKITLDGLDDPVYEMTSSGLTHSYEKANEENRFRVGELTGQLNFGLLRIDWEGEKPQLNMAIRGRDNQTFAKVITNN